MKGLASVGMSLTVVDGSLDGGIVAACVPIVSVGKEASSVELSEILVLNEVFAAASVVDVLALASVVEAPSVVASSVVESDAEQMFSGFQDALS